MTPETHIVLAEGIGPLIFYLLIVAFWTLAKKISEKAQEQRKSVDERHDVDPDLKEFLETLTGQRVETPPPPEPPPAPPRAPSPRQPERTPQRRRPIPREPDTEPAERPFRRRRPAPDQQVAAPAARTRPASPILTPHLDPGHYLKTHAAKTDALAAAEISDMPEEIRLGSSVTGMNVFPRIKALHMPMPGMRLPRSSSSIKTPRNRVRIEGKDALKRIMIERVLLGPPLGMGSGYSDRTYES